MEEPNKKSVPLFFFDFIIFLAVFSLFFGHYHLKHEMDWETIHYQLVLSVLVYSVCRICGFVYNQVWRYGGIQCYMRLIAVDAGASIIYLLLQRGLPYYPIEAVKVISFTGCLTLVTLEMRLAYRYCYKYYDQDNFLGAILRMLLRIFAHGKVEIKRMDTSTVKKIAIVGAGKGGVELVESLENNARETYLPMCFFDEDPTKIGKKVNGYAVYPIDIAGIEYLKEHDIHIIVLAIPSAKPADKMRIYEYFKSNGFEVRTYDYPTLQMPERKRRIREFEIEDLLNRDSLQVVDESTSVYYKDKKILVTGGGGSIGSELCRQLAKMGPKQIVIVDIYENCAYDLQQGLLFAYKKKLDIRVEICSITNKRGMRRIFEEYHPDIVINAAAHKHVPLMEKNCVEAVMNNVFGTKVVVELCHEFRVGRFMMVSTDKAVNPTNVMGATKRVCEMIMQAYSTVEGMKCSATRFGNVLGSAGSVIPLFKRQIGAGGPVTVTDKRIIRYFMTIPEASQLVLTSGAMAKNGELFVLDMGEPVKIWDLAENMIRLSGQDDIEIIETGLRPGEKLYEELLVKSDTLEKTDNNLIFKEKEEPVSLEELKEKLDMLKAACDTGLDDEVRRVLHIVVPTFKKPEEVNKHVG